MMRNLSARKTDHWRVRCGIGLALVIVGCLPESARADESGIS